MTLRFNTDDFGPIAVTMTDDNGNGFAVFSRDNHRTPMANQTFESRWGQELRIYRTRIDGVYRIVEMKPVEIARCTPNGEALPL